MNKTLNFATNTVTDENATSNVLENSLSYYTRILDSPFYGRLRVSYRDEENAGSPMSYLSGEDRLEFASELDYRPNPYINGYLGLRVANVWAENEDSTKHLDAEIRYGLRFTWDTGFRWNTKGNVRGFVFYDLDGDGMRDMDDEGIKSVTIKAALDRSGTTNGQGYYTIRNIIGKEARISIDMSTMPRGYILTTPAFFDVKLTHGGYRKVDFGITCRSEIVGVIFVDLDGNGKFDREEEGLSGVAVVLDDTVKVATDQGGQYLFRSLSPGEHTIKIDLTTMPTKYIPQVSVKKKVMLEEGSTFFYNIPLKIAKQIK
jgi:hypothetical protein